MALDCGGGKSISLCASSDVASDSMLSNDGFSGGNAVVEVMLCC